jgi:hypothetical protein
MKAENVDKDSRPISESWLSVREAAELQRRSEVSVRRDLTKGRLRRYKIGGRTVLRLSDVLAQIRPA